MLGYNPYCTKIMAQPLGIEPSSLDLQTSAMTTSAKVGLVPPDRIELPSSPCKRVALPLDEGGLDFRNWQALKHSVDMLHQPVA